MNVISSPHGAHDGPYLVAMIGLPEGVRVMGNLTGCDVEQVRVGTAVEAYAVEFEPGLALLFWRAG